MDVAVAEDEGWMYDVPASYGPEISRWKSWYHSLHHTQFRTNYCLFMPFYDYIYGTVDMSTEKLYKNSLKGKEVIPDVVHLTHLTTLRSIYLLRIGLS
ncbi:hypothetical protein B296_00059046 [Ensete ventricosum]|uniref:Fatty acid hydroxylase domain-containing protein n=1 Tax=Ensete ventricosum TaxID=4639 RepID=A0A426XJA9_ENSVE|nr:hypothetical protein B296_00059046 [Ensete ventricosum]